MIAHINAFSDDLIEFSFYRTREGTECDLVITRGVQPIIAIELKMNSKPSSTKGLVNAVQDLGTQHNFVVVPKCDLPYKLKENILVTNLSDLLKQITKILQSPS